MFEKDIKYSLLLDFYGDILSERRREIIELYYNEDLSLSEISEITGISRQGVRDSVKKSENELSELEEKLGLAARFENIKNQLSDAVGTLRAISCFCKDAENQVLAVADKLSKINL